MNNWKQALEKTLVEFNVSLPLINETKYDTDAPFISKTVSYIFFAIVMGIIIIGGFRGKLL